MYLYHQLNILTNEQCHYIFVWLIGTKKMVDDAGWFPSKSVGGDNLLT